MNELSPTENELKALALHSLRGKRRISTASTLANELVLGQTGVRADLAILNTLFVGVEIKSNRDSLRRLDKQLDVYHNYFDAVLLLVGERHLDAIRTMPLPGTEIWVSSGTSLRIERARGRQTSRQKKPTHELLTAKQRGKFIKSGTSTQEFRSAFRQAFLERFSPTSQSFWAAVDGRQIQTSDLRLLSRFEETRRLFAENEKINDELWKGWNDFFQSNPAILHQSHRDPFDRHNRAADADEY